MKEFLAQLLSGQPLSVDQAVDAFDLIMSGQATPAQTAAMLAMIQQRGPSVDEIVGAAMVMRDKVVRVEVPDGLTVIDTCGTGGDHAGTFNISTAAALVAAGAARPHGIGVAKHGNRSVTSSSGSSSVLETLGVKLQVTTDTLRNCLEQAGLCFCFAPNHHPAMKHAIGPRQELGFRTLFNVLGPLTNPAGARRQVIGVYDDALTEPIARVLHRLGAIHAIVVHGKTYAAPDVTEGGGGLDEITTTGPTRMSVLADGRIETSELHPGDLGLTTGSIAELRCDGPESSAALVRRVLAGETGPARDIVTLNAAAALLVADLAPDLTVGLAQAREAIDSGAAQQALDKLIEITAADPTPVA